MFNTGLYLMNYKGYHVLINMIEQGYTANIRYVISRKDNHVKIDYFNEIQDACTKNGIVFFENEKPKGIVEDYKIAIGWRWLIIDYENLIILHDSLLPRYRGFAPLVNALINGEKKVGVTMLFATKKYDSGNIIFQESLVINYPIKIQELIESITVLYVSLTDKLLSKISKGKSIEGFIQDETKATYSLWRDEDDYHIDWKKNAEDIQRFINAVGFPYKGAYAIVNNEKLRILDVQVANDVVLEIRQPGKVLMMSDGKPIVVCGKGLLKLMDIRNDKNETIYDLNFRTKFK